MNRNELIVLYFSNKLSKETQIEFDHLLETDEAFANEVNFQKDVKIVIKAEEQAITKLKLQEFESNEGSATNNYKKWLLAASVVVLLGISSIWFLGSKAPNTEKLYANYFEPYRNVVQPIVRGTSDESIKTKAFRAYEQKNYDEALKYLNEMLLTNHDETIAFYKANILLKINKTDEAILIFKQNLKTTDSLKTKTHWYLALSYLKRNDIDKSIEELKNLKALDTPFKSTETRELLKKLK